jgi:hypothetical protein
MTPLDGLALASEAIARVCERHGVAELAVFGSIARGDARPDSDIDLLARAVDLVPKSGLKAMLRTTVLAEARVLCEI